MQHTPISISITMALSMLLSFVVNAQSFEFDHSPGHSQFDCVNAFDLIAMTSTVRCPNTSTPEPLAVEFPDALYNLIEAGFLLETETADLAINWCRLTRGLGFTPNGSQIFIDSGLKQGGGDLLAEILAHEFIHIRQFRELGTAGFKCQYVNAFIQCAACQDRSHQLEYEAYEFQDRVRQYFLERWLARKTTE